MSNERVMIALSGGVDSSVAAYLLKKQGFDCIGAAMSLFEKESADIADAQSVCDKIGIPFKVFDFKKEFKSFVIDNFVKAYARGETPNPCVFCNKSLKFSEMLKKADENNCRLLATGHYARVEFDKASDKYLLKKAADPSKDQSYVLYMLTQRQLRRIRFPLGGFAKSEIRDIADKNSLVTAHKSDSQDICFIQDGNYSGFIENYLGKKFEQGDFVLRDNSVLGRHKGIINYTVGQRRGLAVSYTKPLYVLEIDAENNRVVLGDNADLFTDFLRAKNVNIISGNADEFKTPVRCKAKIRYKHTEQPATAYIDDDNILNLRFDEPQRAVTKGQSVVLYDGDTVLGGGEII